MDKKKLEAILPLKIQSVVELMIQEGFTFSESIRRIYSSNLYRMLEKEETKVWHYSPMLLFDLIKNEIKTGKLELPDYV